MATPRYKWMCTCPLDGEILTPDFLAEPPTICWIDGINELSDQYPFQTRPQTQFQISYTNPISVSGVSTGYTTVGYIDFPGLFIMGYADTVTILASMTGGTGSIRINDLTNSTTICEFTDISGSTITNYNLGTISNLTNDEATWSIDLATTSSSLTVYSITLG